MVAKVNDFKAQNNRSHSEEATRFWFSIYNQLFINMVCWMTPSQRCNAQFMGIDRVILLDNGKSICIDEKLREREYPDILFEYISNDVTGTRGWMDKDLSIDYLAYGFINSKKAYIFDWRVLKRVWSIYKKRWIVNYPTKKALNKGYSTLSVAVPIKEVLLRYQGAIFIKSA